MEHIYGYGLRLLGTFEGTSTRVVHTQSQKQLSKLGTEAPREHLVIATFYITYIQLDS